jgi:hypothetical protein
MQNKGSEGIHFSRSRTVTPVETVKPAFDCTTVTRYVE